MKVKLLEVRDAATFIPVFAFRARCDNLEEVHENSDVLPELDKISKQRYLLARCGYGTSREEQRLVIVGQLNYPGPVHYDPNKWEGSARTMPTAHEYIRDHFDELNDGDVVDVEFILEEKPTKKVSERIR